MGKPGMPPSDRRDYDPELLRLAQLASERLAGDPLDADALFVVAAHMVLGGRYGEANDLLTRLAWVDRRYPGLWELKAVVLEALGDHKAAENAKITRNVQVDPDEFEEF